MLGLQALEISRRTVLLAHSRNFENQKHSDSPEACELTLVQGVYLLELIALHLCTKMVYVHLYRRTAHAVLPMLFDTSQPGPGLAGPPGLSMIACETVWKLSNPYSSSVAHLSQEEVGDVFCQDLKQIFALQTLHLNGP